MQGKWSDRLGKTAHGCAILALVVAVAGTSLARYDLIPKLAGFGGLLGGGLLAALALVSGIAALLVRWRTGHGDLRRMATALVLALPLVAFLATRPLSADHAPAIHDITTDLADPPAFTALPVRADNLVGVGTPERWRSIHARAYPDLRPVTLARPVGDVMAKARRIAQDQGWEIAAFDPAGHMEATASVSYIRFHDDIAVRVRPSADGAGSTVDVRSLSRVGIGDLGVNARRIRQFLQALQAA